MSARVVEGGVEYSVWAPRHELVEVVIMDACERPQRVVPLRAEDGFFSGLDQNGRAGDLYKFRLSRKGLFPDMGSHFQPLGVQGPSEVIEHRPWEEDWKRPGIGELVIYECHIGTFTKEGTFRAAAEKLRHVRELGATAIQLMPVADFAGKRNWGYDMVSLYAPSRCYGRPEELKEFVAAVHREGLAVILDVVYNHFGPDGNYWETYSDTFFAKEGNIWGKGINFAEPRVRQFFVGNVIHWMEHYHVDGFRLDATHAIVDDSEKHVLTEIAEAVHARGGFTIAEDERNWSELVGRMGIDAVWADDFHHVMKMALRPEPFAHFKSYEGSMPEMLDCIRNGWQFRGQVYKQTGKKRGTDCAHLAPEKFVYCISNHDQAGNRPLGERLNQLVSKEAYLAASALLCVLPYTPMIFMGQEFAATTPFCFFTDHAGELGKNVSKGRLKEFQHYGADFGDDVIARMPDPQEEKTFLDSKLRWEDLDTSEGKECLEVHQRFLNLRSKRLGREARQRGNWKVELRGETLAVEYSDLLVLCNLKEAVEMPQGWKKTLSSGRGPETAVFEKV
jgi:maltooligosyltrehalose trehalohydrolase